MKHETDWDVIAVLAGAVSVAAGGITALEEQLGDKIPARIRVALGRLGEAVVAFGAALEEEDERRNRERAS